MNGTSLTTAQLVAIKADITAANDLKTLPAHSDGAEAIAKLYNADSSPVYTIWQMVTGDQVRRAIDYAEYALLTPQQQGTFALITGNGTLAVDGADANQRAALTSIFVASANTRTNLVAAAKRTATRLEKLFATGVGSVASPGVPGFVGTITYRDVQQARDS